MAIFLVLWPYLSTAKLRSVIRHNLGHSKVLPQNRRIFGEADLKHVLGSISIWTFRIWNLESWIFYFLNCTCLKKSKTNIQNSTCPNGWATKDINLQRLTCLSPCSFLWWKDRVCLQSSLVLMTLKICTKNRYLELWSLHCPFQRGIFLML